MKATGKRSSSRAGEMIDGENAVDETASVQGRDRYILEAQKIRSEIGELPQILMALGLNQRRACQLLLVDPSAWTRWNKTGAPPHIYQALRWLLELKKKDPAVTGPIDLGHQFDRLQMRTEAKIRDLENSLAMVERGLAFVPAAASIAAPAASNPQFELELLQERREHLKRIADLEEKIRDLAPKRNFKKNLKKKKPQRSPKKERLTKKESKAKRAKAKPTARLAKKRKQPKKKKAAVKKTAASKTRQRKHAKRPKRKMAKRKR